MQEDDEPTRRHRTISWVDIEIVKAHASKEDYLQGWAEGRYPAPPICHLLNIQLIEIDRGRAVFAARPGEYHCNPAGTVHGGMLSALIDSACGIACMSLLPPGTRWSTVNLGISFFGMATEATGRLRCEGLAVHEGQRVVVVDAILRTEKGQELASGRATCVILPGRR